MSPEERMAQLRADVEFGGRDPDPGERSDDFGAGMEKDLSGLGGCFAEAPTPVAIVVLVIGIFVVIGKVLAWSASRARARETGTESQGET